MSGTLIGGRKAAMKNIANDPDFYRKAGTKGGAMGNHKLKGFAVHRDLARQMGKATKRGKKLL